MAMRIRLLIALAGLTLVSLLNAAPTATRPASGEETETLVYDISDLVRPRVNYPLGSTGAAGQIIPGPGGGGGGATPTLVGGGLGAVEPGSPPRQELADALVKLIEETIDPPSWRNNGGNTGAM